MTGAFAGGRAGLAGAGDRGGATAAGVVTGGAVRACTFAGTGHVAASDDVTGPRSASCSAWPPLMRYRPPVMGFRPVPGPAPGPDARLNTAAIEPSARTAIPPYAELPGSPGTGSVPTAETPVAASQRSRTTRAKLQAWLAGVLNWHRGTNRYDVADPASSGMLRA
ncbi:hypothetical protein ACPPVO_41670 [Dactylosporangium sp. McL0621]|uniref:hypothetical protein n=1 Tax=Dactylosporangium sp. McL0621 TaxID=3415678 RepID=UPI003CF4AEAF